MEALNTKIRTGEVLLRERVISPEQIDIALDQQRQLRKVGINLQIGQILIRNHFASQGEIDNAVAKTQQVDIVDIPLWIIEKHRIIPRGIRNEKLVVCTAFPLSPAREQTLRNDLNIAGIKLPITEDILENREFVREYNKLQKRPADKIRDDIESLNRDPGDGQVLSRVYDGIFIAALNYRASDIHLIKGKDIMDCKIFFRIDGKMQFMWLMSIEAMSALFVRIKTEAGMDISETRLPKDGRINFKNRRRNVDLRVSTIPLFDGESVVIRVLDPRTLKSLDDLLIYYPDVKNKIKKEINITGKSGGLILVTGATGSGKTTTLYAMLRDMPRHRCNILTSEDPVEYTIANTKQTQVNPHVGLTFSTILRSQVRQDPDVLVVGEMRDAETVELALRSAESGHLVLSTLHTNDVKQTINRLIGMMSADYKASGLFVLANYLKFICNQQLLPLLCPKCSVQRGVSDVISDSTLEYARYFGRLVSVAEIGHDEIVKLPTGCSECDNSGYRGRTMALEFAYFPSDASMRSKLEAAVTTSEKITADNILSAEGIEYYSLMESVIALLRKGVISPAVACNTLHIRQAENV